MNLLDWRGRARRARWRWLLRWCLWLGIVLGVLAASMRFAFDHLGRALPDARTELAQLRDGVARAQSELSRLEAERNREEAAAAHGREAATRLRERIARLNALLALKPMRVISLEDRPDTLQAELQVATLGVLDPDLRPWRLQVLTVTETDPGFLVRVAVTDA